MGSEGEGFAEEMNALILKCLPPEEFPGLKDVYGLKVRVFHAEVCAAVSRAVEEASRCKQCGSMDSVCAKGVEKQVREAIETTTIESQKQANEVHQELLREAQDAVWESAANLIDEFYAQQRTAYVSRVTLTEIASAFRTRKSVLALSDAPCAKCGYNGPGYYQSDTHSCSSKNAPA